MRIVTRTDQYLHEADSAKNRGYITLYGTWTSVREVPEVLQDVEKLCTALRPGFSILCDFRESKATALPDIFQKASEILVTAGMKRFAALHERETFMQTQMAKASRDGNFPGRVFYDRDEAEAWLDEEGS
jgi:hypothetical protein